MYVGAVHAVVHRVYAIFPCKRRKTEIGCHFPNTRKTTWDIGKTTSDVEKIMSDVENPKPATIFSISNLLSNSKLQGIYKITTIISLSITYAKILFYCFLIIFLPF